MTVQPLASTVTESSCRDSRFSILQAVFCEQFPDAVIRATTARAALRMEHKIPTELVRRCGDRACAIVRYDIGTKPPIQPWFSFCLIRGRNTRWPRTQIEIAP